MKALFYSHTGKISGAERILLLLLEGVDRRRVTPIAVCPAEGGLSNEINSLGIPVHEIGEVSAKFKLGPVSIARSILSVITAVARLKRRIEDEAPDVIHANSIRAGVVATIASVGSKTPVLWHIQDELGTHPISTAIRLIVRFSKRTKLIPVSAATLKSFLGILLQSKSVVARSAILHNGVDPKRFDVADEEGEIIRRELGIGRDEVVFGCIGQITPRKNQKGLVEAFASVSRLIPNLRLFIVGAPIFNGDSEYFEEVQALVRTHRLESRVHFLGQRTDVAQIISATDAVVVNSHSEALVLVAIEAMMSGRPVIATDVGGTAELVEHLVSGMLIPAGDIPALTEALKSLAENPGLRISLAKEGRRVARSNFTAAKMIRNFERLLVACAPEIERTQMLANVREAIAEGK